MALRKVEYPPKKITLMKTLKDPYTRCVDVMVWGGSRPDLLEMTIKTFKQHVNFTAGKLNFYFDDGMFDKERSDASAAIARAMKFDNVTQEKLGSYGYAIASAWSRDVSAPFVFSLEDDWECVQDIDLDSMVDCMVCNPKVNQIKLNRYKNYTSAFYKKLADQKTYYKKYELPVERMLKDSNGKEWPVLGSLHWYFNPAIWRTSFTVKHFKGFHRDVHRSMNSQHGFLPTKERPPPTWYTDVLGAYVWGAVKHPPYFVHRGLKQSIHNTQGFI
jgi:hypothetical protein